jgi:hypothetical protein
MRERDRMTEIMDVSQVSHAFESIASKVSERHTRVLVETGGKLLVGIVAPADLLRLNQLDAEMDEDWRVVDDIHERNRDADLEEVERDVAAALAAVRATARRKPRRTAT